MDIFYSTLAIPVTTGVSNLFKLRATEREYSGGEGHIVNFSLSWEPQHQHSSNYFISNPYESLHKEISMVTVGCMFCSLYINKTFQRWFFSSIHKSVRNNFSFMPLRAT